MADIARHSTGAIDLNGTILSNLMDDSVTVNSQIQKAILNASGAIVPTFGGTLTATPLVNFTTHNIALLSAPTKITAPTVLTFRAYDEASGLGTGYISLTIAAGLIVPETISANAGQEATLSVAIYPISSDGETNPVIVGTTSKTLAVHGDTYTIGNLNIGGVGNDITGVQSINYNFGFNVSANAGENGLAFPTVSYIDKQDASLTAQVVQLSAATQQRINTAQETEATATFAKLAEGAIPTADSYTVAFPNCIAEAQNINGGRPVNTSLLATPVSSDGTAYVTYTAA